jgi:hypothetical protein
MLLYAQSDLLSSSGQFHNPLEFAIKHHTTLLDGAEPVRRTLDNIPFAIEHNLPSITGEVVTFNTHDLTDHVAGVISGEVERFDDGTNFHCRSSFFSV